MVEQEAEESEGRRSTTQEAERLEEKRHEDWSKSTQRGHVETKTERREHGDRKQETESRERKDGAVKQENGRSQAAQHGHSSLHLAEGESKKQKLHQTGIERQPGPTQSPDRYTKAMWKVWNLGLWDRWQG